MSTIATGQPPAQLMTSEHLSEHRWSWTHLPLLPGRGVLAGLRKDSVFLNHKQSLHSIWGSSGSGRGVAQMRELG